MKSWNLIILLLPFTVLLLALIWWASEKMTKARWQIFATIPLRLESDGLWRGLNLTWYGALTALAFILAIALLIVLTGSVGLALPAVLVLSAFIVVTSLVASRWVAQWVEKTPGTHTIGGALFALALTISIPIVLVAKFQTWFGLGSPYLASQVPALLAALSIAYVYGEGVGRVACISFGCCWGVRVDQLNGRMRRIFDRMHFVFDGPTKKISYASGLEGIPVVPIQSITAVIHVLLGGWAIVHFYRGEFLFSILVSMGGSQFWRFASEFLRADDRGSGRISLYQWMALLTVPLIYANVALITAILPSSSSFKMVLPDLDWGLAALWAPIPLITLQIMGVYVFLKTGKSSVTTARLRLQMSSEV